MPGVAIIGRLLRAIAALMRALAQALEGAAPGRSSDAALATLSTRFPGAPEHWLRVIAERAPHLAEAGETEAEGEAAPPPRVRPPTRLRLAWPARTRRNPSRSAGTPPGRAAAPAPTWAEPQRRSEPQPAPTETSKTHQRPGLRLGPPHRPATPAGQVAAAAAAGGGELEVRAGPQPRGRRAPVSFSGDQAPPRPTPTFAAREPAPRGQAFAAEPSPVRRSAEERGWTGAREPAPRPPQFTGATAGSGAPDAWPELEARPDTGRAAFPEPPPARRAPPDPNEPSLAAKPRGRTPWTSGPDPRWPALPPPDAEETAPAPISRPDRHVAEQELGRWNG